MTEQRYEGESLDFAATMLSPLDPADPKVIAAFERIWTGQATGFSEAALRGHLAEIRQMQADLVAHRIRPSKVVGRGYKPRAVRQVAMTWLSRQIADLELAIETRGRTNTVNVSNVRYFLRSER